MSNELRALPETERGWEGARCSECPLAPHRDATFTPSARPDNFSGLMIIGEGPGVAEARLKKPFQGPSGHLLDKLLAAANLERANAYVANATGCLPKGFAGKEKDTAVKRATAACRGRLLAEIRAVRPRIILGLGNHALQAIVGTEDIKTKRTAAPPCEACNSRRKWKVLRCAACKDPASQIMADAEGKPPSEFTPCCQAKWQPKNISCSVCGGLKTVPHEERTFHCDYKIGEVAGAVWRLFPEGEAELPIATAIGSDPFDPTWAVFTYHPSALLREIKTPGDKKIGGQFLASAVVDHLIKVARLLRQDPIWELHHTVEADPTKIAKFLDPPDDYAVDIETDAKEVSAVSSIKCIAFSAFQRGKTLVVDTEGLSRNHPRLQPIFAFLRSTEHHKTFQNGIYDVSVMHKEWGEWTQGWTQDTLLAHNALAPDEPHNLAHITYLFTDAPPWKPPKSLGGMQVFDTKDDLHLYNARDAHNTALAMRGMWGELRRDKVQIVHDLDLRKAHMAVAMSAAGLPVDEREALRLVAELQSNENEVLREMRAMVGQIPPARRVADPKKPDRDQFHPGSTAQLAWILYGPDGPFRLAPSKFTDASCKTPSTDGGALLDHVEHPFVVKLLAYRKAKKQRDAVLSLGAGPDGRVHAGWNPTGARTGRWSSSPNMQNIERTLRAFIKAPPGRKLVGADLAQAELRTIAALSGDSNMIAKCLAADEERKLEPEYDPHSYVASIAFGATFTALDINDPTHDKNARKCDCGKCQRKLLRDIVKRLIYGTNYGAGPQKVRAAIYDGGYEGPPITLAMVQTALNGYERAFPDVFKFREREIAAAQRAGMLYDAILGRRRVFPLKQVDYTIASNFKIQATIASLMDILMWDLFLQLPDVADTAMIVAQVHDAVYVECDEADAPAVAALVEGCMSSRVRFNADCVWMPIEASAKIGTDWKEVS